MLFLIALGGCGHLARVSKTPLGYVELYEGTEHRNQLRIPYRVQLYELFPTHRYTSSVWIRLDGSGNVRSNNTDCPEGTSLGSGTYEMRGRVSMNAAVARVELDEHRYRSGIEGWHPYELNGEYRLVHSTESPVAVARAEAEAIARDGKFSTVWYCKPITDAAAK